MGLYDQYQYLASACLRLPSDLGSFVRAISFGGAVAIMAHVGNQQRRPWTAHRTDTTGATVNKECFMGFSLRDIGNDHTHSISYIYM